MPEDVDKAQLSQQIKTELNNVSYLIGLHEANITTLKSYEQKLNKYSEEVKYFLGS